MSEKLHGYFRPRWVRILVGAIVVVGIVGTVAVLQMVKNMPKPTAECSKECNVHPDSIRNDRETSTGGGEEQAANPGQENKPSGPGSTSKPNAPTSSPSSDSSSIGGGGSTIPPPSGGGSGTQACLPFPAFPDENCTGVPAGVSLSSVSSQASTSSGQNISGLYTNGNLTINHSNVTVTNTRITGRVINNASLINKACFYSSDHLDAIQFYDPGGVLNATIQHNYIDIRPTNGGGFGNAAIFWADFPGSGSRLNVYNNMLIGGNYTFYGLDAHASSGVIIDVANNRFLRNAYNYGPCALSNSVAYNGTSGVIWNGNAFSDGGAISINDC